MRQRNRTSCASASEDLRQRATNHTSEPSQELNPIEPDGDGASRPGGDGLRDIKPGELTDVAKLLARYAAWRGCEQPQAIDADVLRFVAAAIHAAHARPKNGKPIRNRPALFISIIVNSQQRAHLITEDDEAEAHRRLKAHFHETPAKRSREYDPHGWEES